MTKIRVNNVDRFVELTEIARSAGDDDDVVPLLFAALEEYIEEAEERTQEVAEAREGTRERLGLSDEGNESEEFESDVERKQAEIRERITR